MGRKYYLGLDMGTNSVGWAVTDSQYHLLRAKGKDLWGVREFDEAEVAADRRLHRTSRRNRQREQVRNGLLRMYFADAIGKVDPNFFERLDNSKYWLEDKDEKVRTPNAIFNDKNYKDKDYYAEFPTIYHLRRELLNNPAPHDVRLVYLAISNMFKHRGHFLNASLDMDHVGADINQVYIQLAAALAESTDLVLPPAIDSQRLVEIIGDSDISKSQRAENLLSLWDLDRKNKPAAAFAKLISGLKADLRVIFEDLAESEEKIEVCFSDADFDDKAEELADTIGEADMDVVYSAKSLYDLGVLAGIGVIGAAGDTRYLSEIRCEEYQKHHDDLRKLKRVIKKYFTLAEYDAMFRSDEKGSYSAYVNSYNSDTAANHHEGKETKLRRNMQDRKQDDLYKTIKGYLKNVKDDQEVDEILADIEKGNFLPKQLTSANGVIPNQIHARELKAILENVSVYLPFMNEKDEGGRTVADRILMLFTFRIPYYVGPVTENSKSNGGNGWVIRKEEGPVLPWNIDKKIDLQKTSEEFVHRMVRQCSYISGEKALPKGSLEYERFAVLNEINNLKINGERISVELKQDIYRDLYQQGKKVTRNKLIHYLHNRGFVDNDEQVSGIDIQLNNALLSYGKFKAIFGEKIKEDKYKDLAEQIIFWCTVYGESKSFLKHQLEDKYSGVLDDGQIKRICGLKFRDWGRMSKKFLELPGIDNSTGEETSMLQAMWNYNLNMVELLNTDLFTFKDTLENLQTTSLASLKEMQPEDLDSFYFSAPVRRMVWQTLCVIKELEKVMGNAPDRVFIEMTRSAEEKPTRKDSRAKMFQALYKDIIKEDPKWAKVIEDADKSGAIRSRKMYLYLTQMGRDMYTGKPIDLDKLFDNNIYDIDHIYPRQFVKDDNIRNNLVLVYKPLNANKSNSYPIPENIRKTQAAMWRNLLNRKLITPEKYKRLTDDKPFTDYEMAGFIARQIVETSQGTKGVADILKQLLPDTKIIYSKAGNVSDFRQTYEIFKSRIVNDNHHANDAYLNIVVGNVYYTKFTQNPLNFMKEYRRDTKKNHYNLDKMFAWDVVRNGSYAWKAGNDSSAGTIETVREVIRKQSPLLTRLTFEAHGGLTDATIYGRREAKSGSYFPIKYSDERLRDVTKYGGTTKIKTSYFFLVEHSKKSKRIRTIEILPVYMREAVKSNPKKLEEYCAHTLGLINPVIKVRDIKNFALFKVDGFYMRLSGREGNYILVHNATPLCVSPYWTGYIKKIEKYIEVGKLNEDVTAEKNIELYKILGQKYEDSIFARRPNCPSKVLRDGEDTFAQLDIAEQAECLYQILSLSKIGKNSADLTKIGGSSRAGTMRFNKNISQLKECVLINQSVTGLYENRIDLLSI